MLFPKCFPLLVDCCKDCRGDVDSLDIFCLYDFVGMEASDVFAVSRTHGLRLHQFVHADAFDAVPLPQYIRQCTQQDAQVVFLRESYPLLQPCPVLFSSHLTLLPFLFVGLLDLGHTLSLGLRAGVCERRQRVFLLLCSSHRSKVDVTEAAQSASDIDKCRGSTCRRRSWRLRGEAVSEEVTGGCCSGLRLLLLEEVVTSSEWVGVPVWHAL